MISSFWLCLISPVLLFLGQVLLSLLGDLLFTNLKSGSFTFKPYSCFSLFKAFFSFFSFSFYTSIKLSHILNIFCVSNTLIKYHHHKYFYLAKSQNVWRFH